MEISSAMIERYNLSETPLDAFFFTNWALSIFCSAWLVFLFVRRKYVFIKPSAFVLVFTHLLFQWPLTIFSGFFESFLPDPIALAFVIHGYMIIGLALCSWTFLNSSQFVWNKITTEKGGGVIRFRLSDIWPLLLACSAILAAYFYDVPFSQSGLYALVMNPSRADEFRESSYHSLPTISRYGFQLYQAAIAPFCLCLLALLAQIKWKLRHYFRLVPIAMIMVVLLTGVSLTGARYPLVKAALAVALAFFYRNGILFRPLRYLGATCMLLFPAAVFTMLREGRGLNVLSSLWYLFKGIIVHRVLVVPIQVGAWHLQYTQLRDLFGVSAIPKLAVLIGKDPIIAPLVIGDTYVPSSSVQTYSDAGYLLSYTSYFGLIALPLCIVLLFLLDSMLYAYLRMSRVFLLASIATVSIALLELLQSDYTTVLVSHGLLSVPILGMLMTKLSNRNERVRHASNPASAYAVS